MTASIFLVVWKVVKFRRDLFKGPIESLEFYLDSPDDMKAIGPVRAIITGGRYATVQVVKTGILVRTLESDKWYIQVRKSVKTLREGRGYCIKVREVDPWVYIKIYNIELNEPVGDLKQAQ